jgi:hypothetical protein
VQLTELFDDRAAQRINRLGISYVDGNGVHLRAGLGQSRGFCGQPALIDVRHHDAHLLSGECLDDREADPARCAGDHGCPVLKVFHIAER